MKMQLVHFYPNLMNLYGSYGNVLVLRRYLEALGCEVTVETVYPGDDLDFNGKDFFYMGAGTESSQRAVMADLARMGGNLKAAAGDGAVLFFAGTAMELLGQEVWEPDSSKYAGVGLADFYTQHENLRIVGDVYGHTELYPEAVVGFMNKCSVIHDVSTPLLTSVELGWGNDGANRPEGFHWKNVFASQLTGPLLVKNPKLLETVAAALFVRRGKKLPQERPIIPWESAAYAVTAAELRSRLAQEVSRRAS